MQNHRGFSLIELLIVIVIIGVIAAIAIPNMLAARRAANEGSSVSSIRTLYGANVSYSASVGDGNFAGSADTPGLSSLTALATAGFIDSSLGRGEKSGFLYIGDRTEGSITEPQTFYFSANPSTPSGILLSGNKRYGVMTDGVIRFDSTFSDLGIAFDAVSLAAASPLEN